MFTLKLAALTLFGITNSPYPMKPSLVPSLYMEFRPVEYFYVGSLSSARTVPSHFDAMGPITARWDVELGGRYAYGKHIFEVALGHKSEHGINRNYNPTESHHYTRITYEVDLD